ncbi:hypothetical protein BD410DRAFT_901060 [Rickenella mellea]|uniref:DUF6534 domain-containing protein n=1 Tax=Rickenella mellea TaxID=50990 RepID=A0A4Y7PRD2_9AGAM|nr:hypothetical protein BD410DRAFT_901060 [Rickenella mellea]
MGSQTEPSQLVDATYWGLVCSNLLLGVSIFQGYMFYSKNNDRPNLRIFIGFLLSLDIATASLWTVMMHGVLVSHWDGRIPHHAVTWSSAMESAMTTIITFSSQLFFARRIYLVTNGRWMIPAIIAILGFLAIAAGICRILFVVVTLDVQSTRLKIATTSEGIFAATSDFVATAAMCFKCVDSAVGVGQKRRINTVLRSLLFYTINCGTIVTSAQLVMVCVDLYTPYSFIWVSIHMCLGGLYANTLLAMLNVRRHLRLKMSQSSIDLASIDIADTDIEKVQSQGSEGSRHLTSEINPEGASIDTAYTSSVNLEESSLGNAQEKEREDVPPQINVC